MNNQARTLIRCDYCNQEGYYEETIEILPRRDDPEDLVARCIDGDACDERSFALEDALETEDTE